jgi:hypothetical protein
MMISSPSASDPYAAAAALDRALHSSSGDDGGGGGASSSDSKTLDSGPDVVVTLSQGMSSPLTYNAAGKMSGAPTLDDLGANRPQSLAHASESVDAHDAHDDNATSSTSAVSASSDTATADVDQDAAVPA